VSRQAVDDVADDHLQRLGSQGERAREREMVLRAAQPQGRGADRVEALGHQRSEPIAEHSVGVERQMRSVLLERTEGHDDGAPSTADLGPDLTRGHFRKQNVTVVDGHARSCSSSAAIVRRLRVIVLRNRPRRSGTIMRIGPCALVSIDSRSTGARPVVLRLELGPLVEPKGSEPHVPSGSPVRLERHHGGCSLHTTVSLTA
jgi:hypothetical protein